MVDNIGQWGKQRLKGARDILHVILETIDPIIGGIAKDKKDIPEVTKIVGIIEEWYGKADRKLRRVESDLTKQLINPNY